MRKLGVGIGAMLLAVCICAFGFWDVKRICRQEEESAQKILQTLDAQQEEKAADAITAFVKEYQKNRRHLGIYLNHSEIEAVDLLFFEIQKDMQDRNFSKVYENTQEISGWIQHILYSEIPNAENIF